MVLYYIMIIILNYGLPLVFTLNVTIKLFTFSVNTFNFGMISYREYHTVFRDNRNVTLWDAYILLF